MSNVPNCRVDQVHQDHLVKMDPMGVLELRDSQVCMQVEREANAALLSYSHFYAVKHAVSP